MQQHPPWWPHTQACKQVGHSQWQGDQLTKRCHVGFYTPQRLEAVHAVSGKACKSKHVSWSELQDPQKVIAIPHP